MTTRVVPVWASVFETIIAGYIAIRNGTPEEGGETHIRLCYGPANESINVRVHPSSPSM